MIAAAGLVPGQNAATGSIEGTVVDSVTHAPVKGAIVLTWSSGLPPGVVELSGTGVAQRRMQRPRQITARTDASGGFALRDLPPGTYPLNITHQRYQQSRGPATKQVEVKPGETATATVELTPGATITGHVVDEDGDPLSDCMPQLLPARPGEPVEMRGAAATDVTGQYSMWGISPGKFKMVMHCGTAVLESVPLHPVDQPPPPATLAYPPLFYPGVRGIQEAQVIVLSAGMDKTGVDFQVKPERVFTVEGVVRGEGADLSKATVTLMSRNPAEREINGGMGAAVDPAKGTFTARNVFAGSYNLFAFIREGNTAGIRVPVDVPVPAPLDLELRPAVDVKGKIEVEGEFKFPLNSISVQLVETEPIGLLAASQSRTSDDGSFTIQAVVPGVYRVEAYGPNVFPKSVSWGGQELPDFILDTTAGGTGPLRVLVSTKTATIRGTGPPNQMVEVVQVSAPNPPRSGTTVDAQGSFMLTGLRPGKYRVAVAGTATDEDSGEELTVGEGETATVTIRDPARR